MSRTTIICLVAFLSIFWQPSGISHAPMDEQCTLGVAAGKATQDGRPMIWKTRDTSEQNNEVVFVTAYRNKYVAVTNAGSTIPWMGVNEKGFAILNSTSEDLAAGSHGMDNGSLMRYALGNCATVAAFQHLLDSTNVTGRQTQSNFGVMDSTGAAAIFETAGNQYWKFDANDSNAAPAGYVLRTNFAFNGAAKNGLHDGIYSIERYRRTTKLIGDFRAGDSLNYKSILRTQMRDFSDDQSRPVSVPYLGQWQANRPYGYIRCDLSICRSTSVSAAVIQGVLPGESARLSTLWAMLGQPAAAISVPYWPVGATPHAANGSNTAPLCDIANQIRMLLFDYSADSRYIDSYKLLDGLGGGLWTKTFPAEDSIFIMAERHLFDWRKAELAAPSMLQIESELAQRALSTLQTAYQQMLTAIAQPADAHPSQFSLAQNYPNPLNATTAIQFTLPVPAFVTLKIYNSLGQEIAVPACGSYLPGDHQITWNASELATGCYFYQFQAWSSNEATSPIFTDGKKLLLIK